MTTIRAFFLQIRAIISNFQKRAAKSSSPLPPLVTRLKEEYLVELESLKGKTHWDSKRKHNDIYQI